MRTASRAAGIASHRKSGLMGRSTTGRRRRWAIAASVAPALFALAAAGWVAWEWPAWRASREVRRALAAGRHDDAWKAVARWLDLRPRSAEAQYYRAKAAIATGRRDDVADGLTRAQALGYPEDRLAVLRALIDVQFGRIAPAQPVLARAFAEGGPDPIVDEALARVYLEMYDFPRARAVLSRWADDDPNDLRPPLWRALVDRRADAEPEVILADFQEVLRRDPKHAAARLGAAEELAKAHRTQEAAEAFAGYLADYPDDPAAHLGAGLAAIALGDEGGAASHLDRTLALDPGNGPAHLERGKIDLRRNDPAAALAHFDRAALATPFDPAVHYQRSIALKRLGKDDESAREQAEFARLTRDRRDLEDLQARLADSPGDARLQTQLARWMFEHGYELEGVNWAKKVLLDHPGQPETCLLLAAYFERVGNWDQARFYKAQAGRR